MSAGSRRFAAAAQFLLGVALVAAAALAVRQLLPRPRPLPGWRIVRPPRDVMSLLEVTGDGAAPAIWSGGRQGVAVVDQDTGRLLRWLQIDGPDESLKLEYVTSLAIGPGNQGDPGAAVWVGHYRGLSYRPLGQGHGGGAWQTLTVADGLPSNEVLALCFSRRVGLWVGTRGGLARLRTASPPLVEAVYTQANGLAGDAASVLWEDSRGRLWVGGGYANQPGLSMFDGKRWTAFTTADGLAHDMVNAILATPGGELLIGTGFSSRGGATLYDGTSWAPLEAGPPGGPLPAALAGAKVRSLFLDRGGALWLGSEYDGIARLCDGRWQLFTPAEGLAGWEVKAMLQDGSGILWLGTENGLSRLDPAVAFEGSGAAEQDGCRAGP